MSRAYRDERTRSKGRISVFANAKERSSPTGTASSATTIETNIADENPAAYAERAASPTAARSASRGICAGVGGFDRIHHGRRERGNEERAAAAEQDGRREEREPIRVPDAGQPVPGEARRSQRRPERQGKASADPCDEAA